MVVVVVVVVVVVQNNKLRTWSGEQPFNQHVFRLPCLSGDNISSHPYPRIS